MATKSTSDGKRPAKERSKAFHVPPEVTIDRQQMIEDAEVVGLAGLGHQVGDIDPHRVDPVHGRSNPLNKQVG